jgi:hypothetical protein
MVTVNPYGVLVVVVLFLPTGSSYRAINNVSSGTKLTIRV